MAKRVSDGRPPLERVESNKDLGGYREWAMAHRFCQCCGGRGDFRGTSTHHIVKQHRSHDACNLIRLCGTCHDLAEGLDVRDESTGLLFPKLTIGVCLTLKWCRERAEWDPVRLQQLRGARLPDVAAVPLLFENTYRLRRRGLRETFFDEAAWREHFFPGGDDDGYAVRPPGG